MKKQLLALSMLTTLGLFAQGDGQMSNQQYNQDGCCNQCCCKPCCCPQPKKCIDCECYSPAYYDLQCDWGFFFDVEFLYWYARENNHPYALRVTPTLRNEDPVGAEPDAVSSPVALESLDSSWRPGFRIGIGWNTDCDGWDAYLNWTYLKNSRKDGAKAEFGQFPLVNQTGLLTSWNNFSTSSILPFFNEIKANWRVRFNQVDLEFGRKYWLSPCFTMRPFAGLRGAWTKTRYTITGTQSGVGQVSNVLDQDVTRDASTKFRNSLWGVGPVVGFQPEFYMCNNFVFYSSLGSSILWGRFEAKRSQQDKAISIDDQGVTTTHFDFEDNTPNLSSFYHMSALFDLAIGFRWEESWCCDRYRTALDLGWEHHIWFNHGQYFSMSDQASATETDVLGLAYPRHFSNELNDLGFGGLVVRLRFDF